jgi:hypothetical protein
MRHQPGVLGFIIMGVGWELSLKRGMWSIGQTSKGEENNSTEHYN